MRKRLKVWVALLGLSAASVSPAATYFCVGTIDFVTVSPTGVVTVSSQSSGLATFYPCSVASTMDGVTTDICKAMLSILITAKATGAQVAWGFSDTIGCNRSSFDGGNWYWLADPPAVWYYGPQIQ